MDFDKKSRGQKHHKNKARYKPKQKDQNKPVETVPKHKKIVNPVDSTSSEDEDEGSENETVMWNDFSLLAQAPISIGGHFQFKSDKNAETYGGFDNLQQNNLFSLDLNVLQYSLNCIPFVERCGLDKSYFTESELEDMNVRARTNKVQYERYLSSTLKPESMSATNTTTEQMTKNLSEKVVQKTDLPAVQQNITKDTSDSDQEQSSITNLPPKEAVEVDKAELEDWLDDILGD